MVKECYCRDDWLRMGRVMSILEHNNGLHNNYVIIDGDTRAKVAMRSKAAVN